MSEMMSGAGKNLILQFLKSTNLHYTAAEIHDFFRQNKLGSSKSKIFSKSTIRTYLKTMANTNLIQVQYLEGKRDNYYLAKKSADKESVNISLIGFWLQHYDHSLLMDSIRIRLSDDSQKFSPIIDNEEIKDTYGEDYVQRSELILSDIQNIKNIRFFQGTAMIDYIDIPKIVGVNQYTKFTSPETTIRGIQRPRDKKWIMELKEGLSSRFSALITSSIIYFDIENIEEINPPELQSNGLIQWDLKVPYYEHTFDNEKAGWILDGQQRMWALDYLNLERSFVHNKKLIKMFGPVTILIGDFKDDLKFRNEVNRMYFILANHTKDLPKTLRQELASLISSDLTKSLPSPVRFKGAINKIINSIENNEISPFYHEVDHNVKSFNKLGRIEDFEGKEIRLFSEKALYDLISTIIHGNPFKYKNLDDFEIKNEKWINIIIDYFNAIKCVFLKGWEDASSAIRRNIVINALGMLITSIWTHHLNNLNQDDRLQSLIQDLVKWKIYDEDLDFSSNSEINNLFPRDLKGKVKELYNLLEESWHKSTDELIEDDEVKTEIRRANENWKKVKEVADKRRENKYLNVT